MNLKNLALAAAISILCLCASVTSAAARTFIGVGVGFGVPVWGPAYLPPPVYYPPAYPPAYYYPPPVQQNYGTVAPSSYSTDQCREYTSTQTIGGKPQQIVGTACLQPDGTWRIVR